LNLAVIWKLPVVFVCENNQYMEYTPIRSVTAVEHPAADRASAYGLEPILVDGNDADVMYETARQTIDKARKGAGPSLVEALTYRHGGHSRADPAKYRPDTEVREWLSRDPVKRYRERLLAAGIGEAEVNEIETRAQQKVDAATEEARNGAPATVDEIERQVWSDGGAAWRN
ncbi:MAG: pyruvate dehydrogenase (acetyl-transferring) E1 component subunit alpha, partial [Chloroflexi bacterium]